MISRYTNHRNIDDIGELEDLPWLMFINEECGNLQVVFDDGELTRTNNRQNKKKSEVLHACICQLCDKRCRRD